MYTRQKRALYYFLGKFKAWNGMLCFSCTDGFIGLKAVWNRTNLRWETMIKEVIFSYTKFLITTENGKGIY